jgi:uncharacterized membrane protein HdeD (DUF308 family)
VRPAGDPPVDTEGRKTTMSVSEEDSAVPTFPPISENQYWLRLFMGVLAIGVGIAAFAWPSATVQVIGFLFGLNLLVAGIIRAGLLLFVPGYPLLYRVLGITFGVLVAIVGILCLRNVTGSVALLLIIVALGWLLDGLVQLFLALGRPKEAGAGSGIATGLLMILGAVAILVWPKLGLGAFIGIAATVLVFVGAGQVISGVAGLRAERGSAHPVAGPKTTPAG